MKTLSYFLIIAAFGLFIGGCARSKLTVRLDIYGEDPNVKLLTADQLDSYEWALKKAPDDIRGYAKDRKDLAQGIYNLYEAGFSLEVGTNPSPHELESVTNRIHQWQAYTNELGGLEQAALKSVHQAAQTIHELRPTSYRPETDYDLRKAYNEQIKRALAEVRQSINELGGRMTNAFEVGLIGHFDIVKNAFKSKAASNTNSPEWKNLEGKVDELDKKIKLLAKKGSANMILLSQAINEAADEPKADAADDGANLKTVMEKEPDKAADALKDSMEASGTALGPTTNLVSRLNLLTPQSDSHNDIDREQDPADPVWRILSDGHNEYKWHRAFATNYFYSEGNNSVVIVRDNPMHYRVHSADNNPTALIEGQLRISRALTDAAIQIAGTATGVKMPNLTGKPPQPDPNSQVDTNQQANANQSTNTTPNGAGQTASNTTSNAPAADTASLATVEATVDAEIANRTATFRALSRNLIALRSDFELRGKDDATRANLLGQFESVLRAYSTILKPVETPAATKSGS